MDNEKKKWEDLILEAFSKNMIPSEKRDKVPEVIILGLGIQGQLGKQLSKPLRKTKKIGKLTIGKYNDTCLAVMCQEMGALATEITIRVLTKTRAKVVIGVGFVGALQQNISIGDIIVPTFAHRGEGTTAYYAPKEVNAIPSSSVQEKLEKFLQLKTSFKKGAVFTTAALLKEDEALISQLNHQGILGIECETSALFLISKLYGIDAGAILVATDNPLLKNLWLDPGAWTKVQNGFSKAVEAVYATAEELAKGYRTSTQNN